MKQPKMKLLIYALLFFTFVALQSEAKDRILEDLVRFFDELFDWKTPRQVAKNDLKGRSFYQDLKKRQLFKVSSFTCLSA